jgi:hypothetical protein
MSQLRRVVALVIVALVGWLLAFGAVGAVSASASTHSANASTLPVNVCC